MLAGWHPCKGVAESLQLWRRTSNSFPPLPGLNTGNLLSLNITLHTRSNWVSRGRWVVGDGGLTELDEVKGGKSTLLDFPFFQEA